MENVKEFIEKESETNYEFAVNLRRYFHKNPEVSKCEFNTIERIEKELQKLKLKTILVEDGGVFSEIIGTKKDGINKEIVLRADIDALPIQEARNSIYKSNNEGVMHACGHDAHTASLLTAAKILSENSDLFSGKIKLCFQRGEEIGFGAKPFIDSGLLDTCERSFAFHCWPYIRCGTVAITPGPNNASVDWFKIKIKGHAAHISVPDLGADAVHVISQIVVKLQELNHSCSTPVENVLLGIGKINGGVAYNIIAEDAWCEGTIRTFSPTKRRDTINKVNEIANSIASQFGCTANIEWANYGSALINDEKSSHEVQNVARLLFGKENLIFDKKPSLIGDNMAEFINKIPGVYAFVGTANNDKPETMVALHDPNFDIDEEALKVAVSLFVGYSIQFLNNDLD